MPGAGNNTFLTFQEQKLKSFWHAEKKCAEKKQVFDMPEQEKIDMPGARNNKFLKCLERAITGL